MWKNTLGWSCALSAFSLCLLSLSLSSGSIYNGIILTGLEEANARPRGGEKSIRHEKQEKRNLKLNRSSRRGSAGQAWAGRQRAAEKKKRPEQKQYCIAHRWSPNCTTAKWCLESRNRFLLSPLATSWKRTKKKAISGRESFLWFSTRRARGGGKRSQRAAAGALPGRANNI